MRTKSNGRIFPVFIEIVTTKWALYFNAILYTAAHLFLSSTFKRHLALQSEKHAVWLDSLIWFWEREVKRSTKQSEWFITVHFSVLAMSSLDFQSTHCYTIFLPIRLPSKVVHVQTSVALILFKSTACSFEISLHCAFNVLDGL